MFSKDNTKKNVNESESVEKIGKPSEETGKPSEEALTELTDDDLDLVAGGVSLQHIHQTLDM